MPRKDFIYSQFCGIFLRIIRIMIFVTEIIDDYVCLS